MALVLQIAVPCPLRQLFHYLPDSSATNWSLGQRVLVPFGSRHLVGIIVSTIESDHIDNLKTIIKPLEKSSLLSPDLLALIIWTSQYYHHPIGECFQVALPKKIRISENNHLIKRRYWQVINNGKIDRLTEKQHAIISLIQKTPSGIEQSLIVKQIKGGVDSLKRLEKKGIVTSFERVVTPLKTLPSQQLSTPNNAQKQIIEHVWHNSDRFFSYLLHGITGSGKTEVYLHLTQRTLAKNRQVLVLIPEIGLTHQFIDRFRRCLTAKILLFHSAMTETDRQQAWLLAKQREVDIIIGTRSAIFMPLDKLGLIIVDEEHDSSYKQQDSLRYHARHIALKRAKKANIPIVLGTATPALETFFHAQQGKYQRLELTERAKGAELPQIQIISEPQSDKGGISAPLYQAIKQTLAAQQQVLLFINKRGYAPVLTCHDCQWQATCPDCDARLILHRSKQQLRCHHCGFNRAIISQCLNCKSDNLAHYGLGTEQIEGQLTTLFSDNSIVRIDRDTTQRVGEFESLLAQVQEQKPLILIGTQMLAKGHDFPNVTLVGVIDADQGLFSADFAAREQLAQLIIQVSGRAGRAQQRGKVYIQTQQPEHPFWRLIIKQDYIPIAEELLEERAESCFPPIGSLCLIRARSKGIDNAMGYLEEVAKILRQDPSSAVSIMGPVPALMEKKAGYFRAQLLLSCQTRKPLHQLLDRSIEQIGALKSGRSVKWSIDIDPIDLF